MTHQKKKQFGQHFLHDAHIIEKIVASVPDISDGFVVEIGPGEGALTKGLLDRFGKERVFVVEKDRDLWPILEEKFKGIQLIAGDATEVDFKEITKGKPWVLVGNLPYNVAAAIIRNAFAKDHRPEALVIMVQKEQGERMRAKAGNMSMLSLSVQMYSQPKLLFHVGKGAFSPPPNVESSVLLLTTYPEVKSQESVLAFAKPAFLNRRKQLKRTLLKSYGYTEEKIEHVFSLLSKPVTVRPQELTPKEWQKLEQNLRT